MLYQEDKYAISEIIYALYIPLSFGFLVTLIIWYIALFESSGEYF